MDDVRVLVSGLLRKRGDAAARIIAGTPETLQAFKKRGINAILLPFVGISPRDFPERLPTSTKHLRLVFFGRMPWWKGIEFALRALASSGTDATFTLIGNGSFLPSARTLVQDLRLERRVEFRDTMSRSSLLSALQEFDVMLLPSLHETGSFALIEAMASGLSVICFDHGAPRITVAHGCGIRVPLGSPRVVIRQLAEAITAYATNPTLLARHRAAARAHAITHYDWNQQGELMNAIYKEVAGRSHGAMLRSETSFP